MSRAEWLEDRGELKRFAKTILSLVEASEQKDEERFALVHRWQTENGKVIPDTERNFNPAREDVFLDVNRFDGEDANGERKQTTVRYRLQLLSGEPRSVNARWALVQGDRFVVFYRRPPQLDEVTRDVNRVEAGEIGFLQQPY